MGKDIGNGESESGKGEHSGKTLADQNETALLTLNVPKLQLPF